MCYRAGAVKDDDDEEPHPFVDVEFEDNNPRSSEIASVELEQALDDVEHNCQHSASDYADIYQITSTTARNPMVSVLVVEAYL